MKITHDELRLVINAIDEGILLGDMSIAEGIIVGRIRDELDVFISDAEGVHLLSEDQHAELVDESESYQALRAAGVDNWSGYDDAMGSLDDEF